MRIGRRAWGIAGISLLTAASAHAQDGAPSPVPKPDAAPTTTVVVTGKTPPVVHRIDRSVYDVKAIPQAQSGSVADVLNTLPSVMVTHDGSVTVRGGSVQILIDGKPSAALRGANLATALQSMPANTIDKIEVITNPGAEFRTNAATVINIVTKKTRNREPSGDLNVSTAVQAGRYNGTLSGSAGIGKWTLNGTVSLRNDMNDWASSFDRSALNPADGSVLSRMVANQTLVSHWRANSLDGGASYAAGDKDTLSLSGHASTFKRNQATSDAILFLDPAGHTLSNPTTLSRGPFAFDADSLTGTWKHQGQHDGETFTLLVKHEETDVLDDQAYRVTQTLPAASSQAYSRARNERGLTDEISGDYILPLATDTQFKAGFDIENDQDQAYTLATNTDPVSGAVTLDPAFTNRFLSEQVLSAAYVDYQHPLGKWLAEGGLRVENLTTTLGAARTGLHAAATDLEWSPSLFLSRELTAHQKIKFTYSRRVDRPAPQQLSAAPIQSDAEDITVGNPSLRPARTDSFEAGYDYTTRPVTFSGTAYARQIHDQITQYSYFAHPGDTVLISSFENAGDVSRQGLDMSLDLHPSPKVAYSLSSDIYHLQQTAPAGGILFHQSIVSHFTRATVTLNPTKADQVQVMAMLIGPNLTADGHSTPSSALNLSYTHTLSERLKFVASYRNVANTTHYIERDRTAVLLSDTRWRPHDDTLFIGLDYKLGAVQPGPPPGPPPGAPPR